MPDSIFGLHAIEEFLKKGKTRGTLLVSRSNTRVAALRELADANDVPVFHRYELMRHWAEAGVIDLRTKETDKRRKLAAKLYDCLGRAMTDFLTRP